MNLYLIEETRAQEVLRRIKGEGFQAMCESFSPTTRLSRVWGLIRAFTGKKPPRTNISTDPHPGEFVELQNELVREEIPSIPRLIIPAIDVLDPYNQPFSNREFRSDLNKCNKDSALGHDQISYEVIKKLPQECLKTIRSLFNEFYISSSCPEEW